MNDLYKQCYKAFRADEHEWNGKGHIYVNVNATIQRINELYLPGPMKEVTPGLLEMQTRAVPWSFESKHFNSSVSPTQTRNGKNQYDSFCVGELTIEGLGTRMGTGADTNMDLDTSAKSAQAYALRKAANYFGVAMYLLRNPKEEEALVKFLMSNDNDEPVHMKQAVMMLMDIRRIPVSAANLVTEFGITLDDLKNDSEVWTKILRAENRI